MNGKYDNQQSLLLPLGHIPNTEAPREEEAAILSGEGRDEAGAS